AVNTLLSLQAARSGFETRHVLAVNVAVMRDGKKPGEVVGYFREAVRRIESLPGGQAVSISNAVPWRDRSFNLEFSADGHPPAAGERRPESGFEVVTPGFFATLGLPLIEGRDFADSDRDGAEPVAIVSQSVADRFFG